MAKLGVGMIRNLLLVIIMLIILFTVLADTASDVGDAADNITSAGATVYPLTSFFKRKGIILLSLIAGVIIVLITGFLDLGSGK